MPESQQSLDATQMILDGVLRNPNRAVLDIGAGTGKFGRLLKGKVATITGVEVWGPYITQYGLNLQYDTIINSNVLDLDDATLARHKVAIMGDVLEHIKYDQGKALIDRLKHFMDEIYLSIPISVCIQDGSVQPFEEHVYHWADKEIRYDLGFKILRYNINDNALVAIGTFMWKR